MPLRHSTGELRALSYPNGIINDLGQRLQLELDFDIYIHNQENSLIFFFHSRLTNCSLINIRWIELISRNFSMTYPKFHQYFNILVCPTLKSTTYFIYIKRKTLSKP